MSLRNLLFECEGVRAAASVVHFGVETNFDIILVRSLYHIEDPG